MVLGALGCKNNADFEKKKVNDSIVLDVYYFSPITARIHKQNPCVTENY